jgi:hypothetical protein
VLLLLAICYMLIVPASTAKAVQQLGGHQLLIVCTAWMPVLLTVCGGGADQGLQHHASQQAGYPIQRRHI